MGAKRPTRSTSSSNPILHTLDACGDHFAYNMHRLCMDHNERLTLILRYASGALSVSPTHDAKNAEVPHPGTRATKPTGWELFHMQSSAPALLVRRLARRANH